MRLWSIHPSYLDAKGLVALWREGLLARKVLQGHTRGYRHHSQLIRFKAQKHPVHSIECYLWAVYDESIKRGYHFDVSKLSKRSHCDLIPVTDGQLRVEFAHLHHKLKQRDLAQSYKIQSVKEPQAHPLFTVVPGDIEPWEKVAQRRTDES
jgi:hypothetical protein